MAGDKARLAERCLEVVGGTLDEQETRIIKDVCGKLRRGEELSPQYAVQQWLSLYAVTQLRASLQKEARKEA